MRVPAVILLLAGALAAQQVPNPTQKQQALGPNDAGRPMPIFKVTVVSRTTKAINYHHRTGSTHIDFRGTELMTVTSFFFTKDGRVLVTPGCYEFSAGR